jgi:hypothetical protein
MRASAPLDVDDEADAAGVVLVAWVVEAVRSVGSHRVDTTYARLEAQK